MPKKLIRTMTVLIANKNAAQRTHLRSLIEQCSLYAKKMSTVIEATTTHSIRDMLRTMKPGVVLIPFQLYFKYFALHLLGFSIYSILKPMRILDYVEAIAEDSDTLLRLEREATHSKKRERVQLLRLLKSGSAETIGEAAKLVGISRSSAQRHWAVYKRSGLEAMLLIAYKGRIPRLSDEQQQQLNERCEQGFTSLSAAREYVAATFALSFTEGGLWTMFRRLGYKAKTGRPRHYKQDAEAAEAFKKSLFTSPTT
jgi:transposase